MDIMSCQVMLACHADPCRVRQHHPHDAQGQTYETSPKETPNRSSECEGRGAASAGMRQLGDGTWCEKTVAFFAETLPCDMH